MTERHRGWVVGALGTAQTLAWASSYYLPAVLAAPMAQDIGVGTPTVFAAFSCAMVLSAAVGPWSGRAIDRLGGRPVLIATNVIFALALLALAHITGPWTLFAAWALMGLAMGSGLYEAAFASLVRLYGHGSRNSITGITLIAGFASTIGWPLSAWMAARYGWRGACIGWALMHLLIALPLNASLPRPPAQVPQDDPAPSTGAAAAVEQGEPVHAARTMALLAFVFAATWFTSTAMAAHLPRMLEAAGASFAVAVGIGALVGPSQVAGRLFEFGFLRRWHPLWSARLAAATHPIAVVALLAIGPIAAPVFAVLHGLGNGILTIAKGTLPLALFGPGGYGQRQGWLMMPARIAQAAAPALFGLVIDRWGAQAMVLTMGLGVLAVVALFALRPHERIAPAPAKAAS